MQHTYMYVHATLQILALTMMLGIPCAITHTQTHTHSAPFKFSCRRLVGTNWAVSISFTSLYVPCLRLCVVVYNLVNMLFVLLVMLCVYIHVQVSSCLTHWVTHKYAPLYRAIVELILV